MKNKVQGMDGLCDASEQGLLHETPKKIVYMVLISSIKGIPCAGTDQMAIKFRKTTIRSHGDVRLTTETALARHFETHSARL